MKPSRPLSFRYLACLRAISLSANLRVYIVDVVPTDGILHLSVYLYSLPTCCILPDILRACLGTRCHLRLPIRSKSVPIKRDQHHYRHAVQLCRMQQIWGCSEL